MPKYCKNCKRQGHDEKECYVLHPELFRGWREGKDKMGGEGKGQNRIKGNFKEQKGKSGNKPIQKWNHKGILKKGAQVETNDKFEALDTMEEKSKEHDSPPKDNAANEMTKEWVTDKFKADKGKGIADTVNYTQLPTDQVITCPTKHVKLLLHKLHQIQLSGYPSKQALS